MMVYCTVYTQTNLPEIQRGDIGGVGTTTAGLMYASADHVPAQLGQVLQQNRDDHVYGPNWPLGAGA